MTLDPENDEQARQVMGWGDHWGNDNNVVLNGERSVGRVCKDAMVNPAGFGEYSAFPP
jgi:hypothetical protein